MLWFRPATILLPALLLAGCAAKSARHEPAGPMLTWFGYISGADIRDGCAPDTPDRFRLIQAAEDGRLIAFEVVADGTGGAVVEVRSFSAADLRGRDLSDSMESEKDAADQTRLTPDQVSLLVGRLAATGAFDRPQAHTRLPAEGFQWLVSGCMEGSWFLMPYMASGDQFTEALRLRSAKAPEQVAQRPAPVPPAATAHPTPSRP